MSEEIKIEKGIPIPIGTAKTGRTSTLRKMSAGDSIIIEARKLPNWAACAKSAGIKVCFRALEDGTKRMWRME